MEPDFPVVIVGGGVVGLSTSLFLAAQNVRALLVERHAGTSIQPRARGVNGRTMELMRELGLESALRAASVKLGRSVGIYAGHTLVEVLERQGDGGWFLRRLRKRGLHGQATHNSPTGPCRCTQDELEPVLLEAARARGVEARFSTEVTDVIQDEAGVTLTLLDRANQSKKQIRAAYVVSADGARSPMRTRLGVAQVGEGILANQLNLYFRADLEDLVKGREFSMCLVENEHLRGLFASINNTDLWVLHVSYYPEKGERPEDFGPERCVELIRHAVGRPDLAVELKGALPWQSTVRITDGFRQGRIFFAGDAAHVMPPWGGFGANTGVQDGHNLAWKLSAVLRQHATTALLDTYETERRPVAEAVSAIAGGMSDSRGLMKVEAGLKMFWTMRRVFPYQATVGYGYSSTAVVLEPGATPGPGTTELRGRPGTRAPHLWLDRSGQRISSLDLFGRDFVLLCGPDSTGWCDAAEATSKALSVPIRVERCGVDFADESRRFASTYGIAANGACLVRPDGIVAWRTRDRQPPSAATLTKVLSQVLGCTP